MLENDERTRRFLGVEIGQGYDKLKLFVDDLNAALEKMRLPVYYDNPRFHTSLVWSTTTSASAVKDNGPPSQGSGEQVAVATGEAEDARPLERDDPPIPKSEAEDGRDTVPFSEEVIEKLEAELGRRLREDEFYVGEVCLKIGKDVKRFPLA